MKSVNSKTIIVTGSAGFIGFHVAKFFLLKKWKVIGIDAITDYYDVKLKLARHKVLTKFKNFNKYEFFLEDFEKLKKIFKIYKPQFVVHLAAQPGVRFSLDNPKQYLNSNIISTFNILEICRLFKIKHLLISSTSSIYGNNENRPFREIDRTDHPLSFYAATKKSCEVMAHSYSHSFNIPITIFRFFTVYGPWGRPDMALFKFTKAMLENKYIEVYNFGKVERDFTYIDDLVLGIYKLSKVLPKKAKKMEVPTFDSISSDGPYRIVNIGNSVPVNVLDFIKVLEEKLCIKAKKKLIKHQLGDVKHTSSSLTLINSLVGYNAKTSIDKGISRFLDWYKVYYNVKN